MRSSRIGFRFGEAIKQQAEHEEARVREARRYHKQPELFSGNEMETKMAKRTPVIASHVDTSLRNLLGILLAGGKRDSELAIDGHVWPHRAKRQLLDGKLKAIKDSDGEVVAYKRVATPKHVERGVEWRKTPSGPVHTMQLKGGRRGRLVPAYQLATI